METHLLQTKLYIPPVRPELVSRPRLIERLNDGLRRGRKLTLISAPAGFGKTTLLSEWIAGCGRFEPEVRAAWLSLDEGDDDLARFLAYFQCAADNPQPRRGRCWGISPGDAPRFAVPAAGRGDPEDLDQRDNDYPSGHTGRKTHSPKEITLMSTEIYYFTSTGNSLVVARDIAERTNGTLISISSTRDKERISTDADAIGIVFPVYYASLGGSGLPRIVEQFAGKLQTISSKYLFAVCTHSGGPVDTIENLNRIIKSRGGELAVGFGVQTGIPYAPSAKIKHILCHQELQMDRLADDEKRQVLFAAWKNKLDVFQRQIHAREKTKIETRSAMAKTAGMPWLWFQKRLSIARYQTLANSTSQSMDELIPLADTSFCVNENCNSCGVCARICPVGNIKMVDDRPVWQHHCETCYACFQWCARKAIHGPIVEYEKRDHHPDVKLSDMLRQMSKG